MGIVGAWPDQPRPTIRRASLRWIGGLRPSALSPAYTVSLTYRMGDVPRVFVLDPALDPGHRSALPHVYECDRLCLYAPGEWTPTMWLSKTILPWTAEWLFHYEVWRFTHRWVGGGDEYAPREDPATERTLWKAEADRG